jgi:hypothetical protein
MSRMPTGVATIAVLMILGAIGLSLFSAFVMALGSMGHAGTVPSPSDLLRLDSFVIPPLVLAVVSIIAVIGIYRRSKFSWYLSIALWFSAIFYFIYAALTLRGINYLILASIIIINALFIAYFQSKSVKEYFKNQSISK